MEQQSFNKLNLAAFDLLKQQIKEQVVYSNGADKPDQFMRLNEIAEEFGLIKNQIRQLALTDAKVAKEILTKMNNLEKIMDDVFPDLIQEIQGISKRLDNLNKDFFTTIFRDVLREELKSEREIQSREVLSHIDAGLQGLTNTILEVQTSYHSQDSAEKFSVQVQTEDVKQETENLFQKVECDHKDLSDEQVQNLIKRHAYTKLVEAYTNDREFIDRFVNLYDFGFTNFSYNQYVLKNKAMNEDTVITMLLVKYDEGIIESCEGTVQEHHKVGKDKDQKQNLYFFENDQAYKK